MIRCLLLIALLIQTSSAQKLDQPDSGGGNDPAAGGGDPGVDRGPGGGGGGGQPDPGQEPKPDIPTRKWPTLSGEPPLVIARGGFSGLFPEASVYAVDTALAIKERLAFMCNLQLTKDNVGICLTDIRLDNATNIRLVYPNNTESYEINGTNVTGWFAKDYIANDLLNNVALMQSIYSRPVEFDNQLQIMTIADVRQANPQLFWLNVQYDAFFAENDLNIPEYIEKDMGLQGVHYISSPEIGFLKTMSEKVTNETKLIFAFLNPDMLEPTTKKKYSDILSDLKSINDFASGILVPKNYIWPVNENKYLGGKTTLLSDAHQLGLEVYASGFANDILEIFNYTYDPTSEYLQFINDDPDDAIDGMVTDFCTTAINAITCFATNETMKEKKRETLIITNNGASGTYPGCTDLAYEKALIDGADVIDCMVQMSKDGVAFCLSSPDLIGDTTAMPTFLAKSSSVPEIQKDKGIFSFDLKWTEIQSLKPQLVSPYTQKTALERNPEAKNKGKFMTLDDFLGFAKSKEVGGVLIGIENAAYLASKKGLDIVDAVTKSLKNASLDKVQVMIQSDDSSVLSKFQGEPAYKRLLKFKEYLGGVTKKVAKGIKKYADGVVVQRLSLILVDEYYYTQSVTNIVKQMHKANLTVYVYVMRNEFVSIPYDYYGDPIIELDTYVANLKVDGVITEFPATASRYLRSPCANPDTSLSLYQVEPGALVRQMPPNALPPTRSPYPQIEMKDVVDPPLPPVTAVSDIESKATGPPTSPPSSGIPVVANLGTVCSTTFMALALLLFMGQ